MILPPKRIVPIVVVLSFGMSYYFFGLLLSHVRAVQRLERRDGGYSCGNDLYPIWLTTRELLTRRTTNPYSADMEHQIESGLYGRPLDRSVRTDAAINYRGFSYPLYTDLLFVLVSLVPFPTVRAILFVLFPILILLTVRWWISGIGLSLSSEQYAIAALLTLFSVQALEGWWALQPTVIVGVLLAAALAALRRSELTLAGIALAFGTVKPQLIFLPALWLTLWTLSDWSRRKRAILAFSLTTVVLLGLSELWVPRWWMNWWHQLPAYRQFDSPPLAELLFGNLIGRLLGVVTICFAVVAVFRWRYLPADTEQFSLFFGFLLAAGVVFISSSIAVYDQILLAPGMLVLWRDRSLLLADRTLQFVIFVLLSAFFWPWLTAPMLCMTHLIAPSAVSQRTVILPLTTAASFPVLLLGALAMLVLQQLRKTTAKTSDR